MPTQDNLHVTKFKARAKTLLKDVQASEPNALLRVAPYFNDLKLSHAQLVIARELMAKSWRALIARDDWLRCSFCKKFQYDLQRLIAGPDDVFVCDECVALCNEILAEAETL